MPLTAVLLPFSSHWAPFWVALGTLALDLLAAVVVTSLLRKRLQYGTWRAIHWAAYAAWPIAYLHGLGAGSDAATAWMLGIDVACLMVVGGTLGWRFAETDRRVTDGVSPRRKAGGRRDLSEVG